MRTKPEDTDVSDEAWEIFNTLADLEAFGDAPEDWMPWFLAFEAGYIAGLEE